ncbi:MAG: hypothetical protein A3J38_01600 [Gammaproteobacteria bacterium RIFCSPHIGHO2_12_FULL_45_9]|nr:MAG: hypothetical protein A3J38_01600 [Gammaproteobacteria bacterium RIFCSPHIGHO2_12_FULL_45_9]
MPSVFISTNVAICAGFAMTIVVILIGLTVMRDAAKRGDNHAEAFARENVILMAVVFLVLTILYLPELTHFLLN